MPATASALVAGSIGVIGSAWNSGNTISTTLLTVPALIEASSTSGSVVKVWEAVYNRGVSAGPKFGIAAFLAYAYATYEYRRSGLPWVGLAGATLLSIGVIPWTLAVMLPTNAKLLRAAAEDGKGISLPAARELLTTWGRLNFLRGLWPLAAAGLGLWVILTE